MTTHCDHCGIDLEKGDCAAWDGNDNEVCFPCFNRWGWKAFRNPPTPQQLHQSFMDSLRIDPM